MKKNIHPSLADLTQDIAGAVPVDLVQSWIESESNEKNAQKLLSGYKIRGTLVSSDTAGLSKLSKEKDLLEVLKIVSDPKEIVYGLGRHIGGEGVARWVADNTQMFFPENIEIPIIVNAVFEANKRIIEECRVKLGFCIHSGEFINLGGGFYGEQADFMEEVAENQAGGGEVLITETIANIVKKHDGFEFAEKELEIEMPEKVFRLEKAKGLPDAEIKEKNYPIYFDQQFFNYLKELDSEGMRDIIYKAYSKPKIIVLIQKKSSVTETGLMGLLDMLVENAVFSVILKRIGKEKEFNPLEIKIAGSFAIHAFEIDEVEKAIDFSQKVRDEMLREGLKSVIGIDAGDVLLFPLKDEPWSLTDSWDLAGGPINIASKQAQDFGEDGKIYITKSTAGDLKIKGAKPYKQEISHIILEGWEF